LSRFAEVVVLYPRPTYFLLPSSPVSIGEDSRIGEEGLEEGGEIKEEISEEERLMRIYQRGRDWRGNIRGGEIKEEISEGERLRNGNKNKDNRERQ
jgi:hypothetical protein